MKVFNTSGEQLVATDQGAVSNAISVVSQALSVQAAALSVRIDTQSNAVSVVSQAISVLSQATSVADAALSTAINTVSNALSNQISIHNVLSNRVSANSGVASVTSQEMSVANAALSVRIDTQSQSISVISTKLSAIAPVGNCRLTVVSTTFARLDPYQGSRLWINGAAVSVPSAGVILSATGLTSATTYNVYAYLSAVSVLTLEATTSAHVSDTVAGNVGVEIKSGDATRTLVGLVRLNATLQFVDSVTQRFCLNWFNRRVRNGFNGFTANRTTTSVEPTYVEVNAEIRVEFLVWAETVVIVRSTMIVSNNTLSNVTLTSFGFDGTTAEDVLSWVELGANFNEQGTSLSMNKANLTEGYHFVTLLGAVAAASTGTWFGAAAGAAARRCTLYLEEVG